MFFFSSAFLWCFYSAHTASYSASLLLIKDFSTFYTVVSIIYQCFINYTRLNFTCSFILFSVISSFNTVTSVSPHYYLIRSALKCDFLFSDYFYITSYRLNLTRRKSNFNTSLYKTFHPTHTPCVRVVPLPIMPSSQQKRQLQRGK